MMNIKKCGIVLAMSFLMIGCTKNEGNNNQPAEMIYETESLETSSESFADSPNTDIAVFSPETEAFKPKTASENDSEGYDFTICFAGDICLDENAATTKRLDSSENGISDCIDPYLISRMQSADVMCLNNEFTYSLRGAPLSGKTYTFRANPERVSILKELGVDTVTLANNHAYDYGRDSLLDTMSALSEAGISYFGAGSDLNEAKSPYYMEVNGKKIAFVGASRAEKNPKTPQATDDEPGILRCYDTELVINSIKEANELADFVIVFVHWGTEYSDILEGVQITDGHDFIEAGADAVIGAHSHCLQGFEFYQGAPIVYSLGNYWFNTRTLNTMLVELHFFKDQAADCLEVSIIPALQKDCQTSYLDDSADQRKLYDYLESISINVSIDENGSLIDENQNN